MKFALSLFSLPLLAIVFAASAHASDLSGHWVGQYTTEQGQTVRFSADLLAQGGRIVGSNLEDTADDGGSDSGGGRNGGNDENLRVAGKLISAVVLSRIEGSVDAEGHVEFVKTYDDHANVEFVGSHRAGRIHGQWIIENTATGSFSMQKRD